MKQQIDWTDDTQTVLRVVPVDDWAWTELDGIVLSCVDMMREVQHQVDLIVDLDQHNGLPPGNPLPHFGRAWTLINTCSGFGRIIITNIGPLGQSLADLFMRIYDSRLSGKRIHFVASYAEALDVLRSHQ